MNTKSLFQKQIKKICCIPFLLVFISIGYSQNPLPENAKLRTIKYGGFGDYSAPHYVAIGYINKKQFVENQEITFMSVSYPHSRYDSYTLNDTIISGEYHCLGDGNSYIKGFRKYRNSDKDFVIKGTFRITNKKSGIGITPKKKEGSIISVHIEKLSYYKAFDSDTEETVILQKLPNSTFSLKIIYSVTKKTTNFSDSYT